MFWSGLTRQDIHHSNMATIISLMGRENPLEARFFPPLEGRWELGMLSLHSRNIVPNITEANNIFYYDREQSLKVPVGYYNLDQLAHAINNQLLGKHSEDYQKLTEAQKKLLGYSLIKIGWNPTLERVEVFSAFSISSRGNCNLIRALGFEVDTLMALRTNVAEREMCFYADNIIKVNCPDVRGGYSNGKRCKTIYEFDCDQQPGARFTEKPNLVTYFPVLDRSSLRQVKVELCNGKNELLNLNNELTLVRLHLRDANI